MLNKKSYPFAAISSLSNAKLALLLALINPKAGGLIISGERGTGKSVLARSTEDLIDNKVYTVPLNITEDMLFGTIDLEEAIKNGNKIFKKGVLGKASNDILYIDEINLLRQDLLSSILEVKTNGKNLVEREGISFQEDVNFTIIGTMNKEEGVIPSNLLDRIGMFVEVYAEEDLLQRTNIVQNTLAYEKDPLNFYANYVNENNIIKNKISRAKVLLDKVEVSTAIISLATTFCAEGLCKGHRGEIFLVEAAKALAAYNERNYVLPEDVRKVALFVLPHRMQRLPERQDDNTEQEDTKENEEKNESGKDDSLSEDSSEHIGQEDREEDSEENSGEELNNKDTENKIDNSETSKDTAEKSLAFEEKISDIDKNFKLPKIFLDLGKDKIRRIGSGKRNLTKTTLKKGRYVRSEIPYSKLKDLAFDATIRAAAPFQRLRKSNGLALNITLSDLREKVREKRVGNTFLFVVDASGSMGAKERMKMVKGVIFKLLEEAYQKRDRVGLIAFRKNKGEVVLPITRSVDLAQKLLAKLPTGGKTPLAEGLELSLNTILRLNKKDKDLEPILILITDGRANFGENALEKAEKVAGVIKNSRIISTVIDTENDFIKVGGASKIAKCMEASYYKLNELNQKEVLRIVRNINV